MVFRNLKDRLVKGCGRVPSIFFLPLGMRDELQEAWSKHVTQTIYDVEEQLASESDDESVDVDSVLERHGTGLSDTEISAALALLHVGEHLSPQLPAVKILRCATIDQHQELQPNKNDITFGGADHFGRYLDTTSYYAPSNSSFSQTYSDEPGGSSASRPPQTSDKSRRSQTSTDGDANKGNPEKHSSSKKRASIVDTVDTNKRQRPAEQEHEFPDLFYAQHPERYASYKYCCSADKRMHDFIKNSLAKHHSAGHFTKEFGSVEAGDAAYDRVMSAKAKRGDMEGLYRAKRKALWGTPISWPVPQCPDHGTHDLYEVNVSKRKNAIAPSEVRPLNLGLSSTDDNGLSPDDIVASSSSQWHDTIEQVDADASAASAPIQQNKRTFMESELSLDLSNEEQSQVDRPLDATLIHSLQTTIHAMNNSFHAMNNSFNAKMSSMHNRLESLEHAVTVRQSEPSQRGAEPGDRANDDWSNLTDYEGYAAAHRIEDQDTFQQSNQERDNSRWLYEEIADHLP